MRPPGMVSALFMRALFDIGVRAGVDVEKIRESLKLTKAAIEDVNGWVSVDVMTRAWIDVPRASSDPEFGLHAAESMPTGLYGVLEYATISSPTLRVALERVARYYRIVGAMSEVSFLDEGETSKIVFRSVVAAPEDLRHYSEHFLALIAARTRLITAAQVSPTLVSFPHAAPKKTDEHARIFKAPVYFSQPRAELTYRTADLTVPLSTFNPDFLRLFEREEAHLAALDNGSVAQRIRNVLPGTLRQGEASVGTLSRKLGLSTRTLQRKLQEEGISFTDLVDQVREEEARRYVAESKMSLGEIAFVLGFSQPSAFFRAFKRWTGTTPSDFRSQGDRTPA